MQNVILLQTFSISVSAHHTLIDTCSFRQKPTSGAKVDDGAFVTLDCHMCHIHFHSVIFD